MPRQYLLIALVALAAAWPTPAYADESADDEPAEQKAYSDAFTGAFQEYSLRGAWSDGPATDYEGWSIDLGFRHSFPMLLGDARLSYRFDRLSPEREALPDELERHAAGLHLNIHPLYLALLGSDWLGYTIASLYFEIGGGVQYAMLDTVEATGEYEEDVGLFGTLGAGIDMPLWDADVGQAPWLNIVYRFQYSGFDRPTADDLVLRRHEIFVGVGWRINGLLF